MNPLVSIITVNFNQPKVTEELLSSIARTNNYLPIEIIVIDNGSRQNPVPQWQTAYPDVFFIRSEANLGFAGGNNLGIKQAKGKYLFLVNNDTEFTAGLVEILVKTMENDTNIGIISPKIRYFTSPDLLQYAGFTPMNYYTARNSCIGYQEPDNNQYQHLSGETGYIHGAAMMARATAVLPDNLMPENYFLYYEEMDWCDNFRRKGYKIALNLEALIYHKESVSVGANSPLKEFFMNRNRILFIRRNAPFLQKIVFLVYFPLVVMPRNILSYIKNKQLGFIPILFHALFWNITHSKNSKDLGYKLPK
ncbi:MAG: glycosyltransferase family 2 protein [Chitinophagia bacterium]|nr:glycosyltransferase family 2 protein [Chitinophagia bacterium]